MGMIGDNLFALVTNCGWAGPMFPAASADNARYNWPI